MRLILMGWEIGVFVYNKIVYVTRCGNMRLSEIMAFGYG